MNFNKAEFDRAFGVFGQLPKSDMPETVFSGKSNVGKSSLLNKLFNRKNLARVSTVPGKTVTVNFNNVDGHRFVDLPGYGYARISKREKERFGKLVDEYFHSGRNIALVVQLIDMQHKPSADDLVMIDFLKQTGLPFIVVLTKADRLNKKEYESRLAAFDEELGGPDYPVIPFSALTGQGLGEIKARIAGTLEK